MKLRDDLVKRFLAEISDLHHVFLCLRSQVLHSVDARSLMGILSIDLNRVLELRVPSDYQCMDALQRDIQPFLA